MKHFICIKTFFVKNKFDILALTIILFLSFLIRIFKLNFIPANITGDETVYILDIYKILFTSKNYLFSLMSDGSVAGIVFYPASFLVNTLSLTNTVLGLRLSSVIFSTLALIPFYFLLKNKTSVFISFFLTLLLSVNYVYLNFSRTGWPNTQTLFWGLGTMLLLEKAERGKKLFWYIISGIFAGVTLYGYQYGRIFVLCIILYLLAKNISGDTLKLKHIKKFMIFLILIFVTFSPFLLNIFNNSESFFTRTKAVYVYNQNNISGNKTSGDIFQEQVALALEGFIFLDGKVMSNGIENQRYLPLYTPPVNIVIKIIFISGLVYVIVFRRNLYFWWPVFISVLITQLLTGYPPNFARGLFYIPFIYFTSGLFLYWVWIKFAESKLLQNSVPKSLLILLFIITSCLLYMYDLNKYFMWMQEKTVYSARQPAIDYWEFSAWQDYQITRIKNNQYPITNYEWYAIRPKIIQDYNSNH